MKVEVPVSAIVLTANEAGNLPACLASLSWADELLILDAFSTDGSLDRCGAARVIERRFDDFAAQRQHALRRAGHDWVLFVDADERVSSALASEIRVRAGREAHAGYWIPRRNRIFGHWTRASGWAPDRQLRLMDRRQAHYDRRRKVHELVCVRGSVGVLANPLQHLGYDSVAGFRARQRRYARMQAEELFMAGVRRRSTAVLAQPVREFVRRYCGLRGYRDGLVGLVLAILMAEHEWHVQRLLRARWGGVGGPADGVG